jgi:hypothetical protein
MHYDDPPPDVLENLQLLHARATFRFANQLRGSIEVENNRIVDAAHLGHGYISSSHIRLGSRATVVFMPTPFPELQPDPEFEDTEAVYTNDGWPPLPHRLRSGPYFQWSAPAVWTTLELTIRANGSSHHKVIGASQFPRHWIYDDDGRLVEKTGLASFRDWERSSFGRHTPWGEEDSQPLMTIAESALERQLSVTIMHGGAKPAIRKLGRGEALFEQGQVGREIFLLLDGLLNVSVDDESLGNVGPGAILGERAMLGSARRTATLRAQTECLVAMAGEDQIDRDALVKLADVHRREDHL